MKRKNMITAMICAACLAAAMPAVLYAEETEVAAETEVQDAAETEIETEAEAETEAAVPVRPDYIASDYVKLGEYKGLTLNNVSQEVTDEQIDEEITYRLQSGNLLESVSEGKVQSGDIANIDYEGKLDGVAFDGGTAQGYDLGIGTHSFIDGFEDGLIGVGVGETVDLNLTFPENYGNADLAGKETVFTVTVNSIKRVPELNDELAEKLSDGECKDVDSYRASVREELEAAAAENSKNQMRADALTQVANNSEITDYPQEMLDYGLKNLEDFYREYAELYSMEFEDFISAQFGMTMEQFQVEALEAVKENLQQEMYLLAIAEAEKIEVSDEEFQTGCEEFAAQYGYESTDDLIRDYGEDTVRVSILQAKVMDFLLENGVTPADTEAESETESEA